jgi:predicted nucleic acid-binding protein
VLVAVDTNVLLDQALEDADVLDALATIRTRLAQARFVVTPTVLEEIAYQCENDEHEEARWAAGRVLECLLKWEYEPLNVIAVGMGIAEQISFKSRSLGIIPEEEQNDAAIVAEAALLGCSMLLSSDAHLLEAGKHPRFLPLLDECSVDGDRLVIARPRDIVRRFYQRR